jgi:uncharacterized membrane protein YdjX (TVP38/TMEM64 family)
MFFPLPAAFGIYARPSLIILRGPMLEQLVHFLESLRAWLAQHPHSSMFVFAGVFVFAQLFMVPVSPLGLAAGLFFGFGQGWLALMLGCAAGASLNFFISRYFARDFVRRRLGQKEKFRLIEKAIEREGWRIVALLRFVPIPFGLANYCYGLTPIPYLPYIIASCLAIIPANSLFVWMGSTFDGELAALLGKGRARNPLEYVLLGVGLLAAIFALRMVAKVARNAVARGDESPSP